jgi:uncharacterized protein YbjT (DUF2867 family)
MMKCLITGATGNIGSRVTQRLIERGVRPCIFVRDAAKARAMFGDAVEIRIGDLTEDQTSLAASFAGIDSLFLLNSGPDLAARDGVAALAAKAAGVRQLVKLSTLDVHSGVGTGPWHASGESAVRDSGVALTFIQTAAFMSNALYWAHEIESEGLLRSSTGEGKIAFIHPHDIAEVSVRALTTRDYHGESLVITGPRALSYAEMAAAIGTTIEKAIRFVDISDSEARDRVGDGAEADALVDIWRAIRKGRVATVTDGVQRILGREPSSFDQWVAENAEAFVRPGATRGNRGPSAKPRLSRPRAR